MSPLSTDNGRRTECEDRANLKQNSQLKYRQLSQQFRLLVWAKSIGDRNTLNGLVLHQAALGFHKLPLLPWILCYIASVGARRKRTSRKDQSQSLFDENISIKIEGYVGNDFASLIGDFLIKPLLGHPHQPHLQSIS